MFNDELPGRGEQEEHCFNNALLKAVISECIKGSLQVLCLANKWSCDCRNSDRITNLALEVSLPFPRQRR